MLVGLFHELSDRIGLPPRAGQSARDYQPHFIRTVDTQMTGWDDAGPGDGVQNVPGVHLKQMLTKVWGDIYVALGGSGPAPKSDDLVQNFLHSTWVTAIMNEIATGYALNEHVRIAARRPTPYRGEDLRHPISLPCW